MVGSYIKELLVENNRVIVPDFGAFIARVNSDTKTPDSLENKTIVFNDILKFNDGLLVNYIIKVENIDLTVALQKITDFIQLVTNEFAGGNDYLLDGIGKLNRDKRGNITLVSVFESQINSPEVITEIPTITDVKKEEIIHTEISEENKNTIPVVDVVVEDSILEPKKEEIVLPPPIPQAQIEENTVLSPSIEKPEEPVLPVVPPIPTEENVVPVVVLEEVKISEPAQKIEEPIIPKEEPAKELAKDVKLESVVIENTNAPSIKPEPKEEKKLEKPEKKAPEIKEKPVKIEKPVKKETKSADGNKKKGPKWLSITIWSVSGLLFLALIFMASVKFGFIKGVKLFSEDQWISVNDKLHQDLEEYNKKHKDKLTLPEVSKDDNNKGAFSGTESGTGSAGSFDAPATDTKTTESTPATTTSSSSEGSFGSFDTPTDTKTKKEEVKEVKEQKPAVTKTETKKVQPTESSNSAGATGKFVLVAGSFSNKNAADVFIEQIKKKGFTNADYVGVKNGMHMVCYGSYNDQAEASTEFQKLQQKGVQTWILKQ